jgi:prephenate dehydrogenase
MHEGSLLMDIASVKRKPMESMKRFTKEGVEILGTHPLFGPTAKSMQGQSIIFVPLREGRLYEEIYEMFRRNGARIEFLDAEKHDEIMSVVQGLTHFILISFGITLRDLNFDVEASRKFMSPTCEMLMDFVGRILHQDSHLYALIQTNLEMGKIDEAFLSVVNKLYELISDKKVDEFMEEMRMAKKHFGDTKKAMINSDKVIEEKIKKKWKNM